MTAGAAQRPGGSAPHRIRRRGRRAREWIGTYTAFSGAEIRSELLRTRDFRSFTLQPMTGRAARNKGMALFPRKIGGRYTMLGRQDGKNQFLLASDDLGHWDDGELLLEPVYPWELVQIGNCGPPIELDEGWLVLTHGVGAMRKYAIGAVLLDKDDPSKVLGRTPQPLLSAADDDRDGYVPNVVYTCGGLRVGDDLFMPYGVADMTVAFAFVPIKQPARGDERIADARADHRRRLGHRRGERAAARRSGRRR